MARQWNGDVDGQEVAVTAVMPAAGARWEQLRELVKEYEVVAQNVNGWLSWGGEEESRIGFSIELCGQHASAGEPDDDCAKCRCLAVALRAIAHELLPDNMAASFAPGCTHLIGPLAISERRPHTMRLTVLLLHPTLLYAEEESEPPCVQLLQSRLEQMGIGRHKDRRAQGIRDAALAHA